MVKTLVSNASENATQVYKRADLLSQGEPYRFSLPPTYVRVAMTCAVIAFAAQMVFYIGREWAIHRQVGRQVRRVPPFWNNLFNVAMIFMYMAIGVIVFGLIQMQEPQELREEESSPLPLSAGVFCANSLLVLYMALYAALQIAKTMDVDFRERGMYPESLTDPSRYIIEVLKIGASTIQTAPMLAVLCVAVQLTINARNEELPGVVENAMYMSCFALFLQAAVAIATPFLTGAELKVVPGMGGAPDVVDFASDHPHMFNVMSGARWICTAVLYGAVAVICSFLWSQKDSPSWVILVMHLATYFFIVHLFLFVTFSLRTVLGGGMNDAVRTLVTAKDAVALCPMLAVLFMESWVAASNVRTPLGTGVPQGYAQDYMFVATWALLIQLLSCFINGFVFSLPKDSKVMRTCGNTLRGGLAAISVVFYLAMVTVYVSTVVVIVARYTNTSRSATGAGAWFG
ncbi:unnamed protein product [Effrenium voratum]|nr:unnamed protein product [Effrenium voratum]CAJ1455165.1 unnamed protein product [Effrenium voratum]